MTAAAVVLPKVGFRILGVKSGASLGEGGLIQIFGATRGTATPKKTKRVPTLNQLMMERIKPFNRSLLGSSKICSGGPDSSTTPPDMK